MLFLFELGFIIAFFVRGCWTKRLAAVFLPIIAAVFVLFAVLVGNPIGLLVSEGGWLILDLILAPALLVAEIANQVRRAVPTPTRNW